MNSFYRRNRLAIWGTVIVILGLIIVFLVYSTHNPLWKQQNDDTTITSNTSTTSMHDTMKQVVNKLPVYSINEVKQHLHVKYLPAGRLLWVENLESSVSHIYTPNVPDADGNIGGVLYDVASEDVATVIVRENGTLYAMNIATSKKPVSKAHILWREGKLWKRIRDFVAEQGGWIWSSKDHRHIQILYTDHMLFDLTYKGHEDIDITKEQKLTYLWKVCYYDHFPIFPINNGGLFCQSIKNLPMIIKDNYHYAVIDDWNNIIMPSALYLVYQLRSEYEKIHKDEAVLKYAPYLKGIEMIKTGVIKPANINEWPVIQTNTSITATR